MKARARPRPARGERPSSCDPADDRGQAATATSKTFAPRPRASHKIPRSTSETARRPPPTAATRPESFAVRACLDVLGAGARPQDSLGLAIPDGYLEASKPEHLALRKERSRPIVDDFFSWAQSLRAHVLPKSPLGQALGYAVNQQQRLELFLTDPRIPIHKDVDARTVTFWNPDARGSNRIATSPMPGRRWRTPENHFRIGVFRPPRYRLQRPGASPIEVVHHVSARQRRSPGREFLRLRAFSPTRGSRKRRSSGRAR